MGRFGEVVVDTEREPRDALGGRAAAVSIRIIARSSSVIIPAEGVALHAGEITVQDNHLLAASS